MKCVENQSITARKVSIFDILRLAPLLFSVGIISQEALLTRWILSVDGNGFVDPSYCFGRALITVFAFYFALFVQSFSRKRSRTLVLIVGVFALIGSCTCPIYGTIWGLPVFVGAHLIALMFIMIRTMLSAGEQFSTVPREKHLG